MIRKSIGKLITTIVFIFIATGIISIQAFSEPQSLNERLTKEAWEAYNKGKYQQAIKKAEECIDEFQPAAMRQQNELKEKSTPAPPDGQVPPDKKKEIMNRGLLNDVATCWWIIGRSNEKLGKKEKAIQAFCNAAKFTYARTYDPSWDGFWSPSQSAMDRVKSLEGNCK